MSEVPSIGKMEDHAFSAQQYDPEPPQTAQTPGAGGRSGSMSFSGLSDVRQNIDERLLATPDDTIKKIWKIANATIGALIMINGICRMFAFHFQMEFFILSVWLIIFGFIFILIELQIPATDAVIRSNMAFMYLPGFRAFFLTFVGTLQWWWWLGITVSIFCFLGAMFNFYVMKTHPAFGHREPEPQQYEAPTVTGASAGVPGYIPEPSYREPTDQYGNASL